MALGMVVKKALGIKPLTRLIADRIRFTKDVPPLKKGDWLRVSSFANLCPREEVICSIYDVTRKDNVAADLALTFANGTALHWALQNQLLPQTDAILGRWTCLGCGLPTGQSDEFTSLTQLVRRPEVCSQCKSSEFLYREFVVRNEEFRIQGHPDAFLQLPGMPGIGILEAKSISIRRSFEIKQVPQMDHMIQAQIYMWLTGRPWGKILYWIKGIFGMEALVEHHAEKDDDTIAQVKNTIRSIWDGVESGKLPTRICATSDCPRAQTCQVVERCFKLPELSEI